jgi:hypothetical protein
MTNCRFYDAALASRSSLLATSDGRYIGDVSGKLTSLDIFIGFDETDSIVKGLAKRLAKPLKYKPHDAEAIVYGQVIPHDLEERPYYLQFHADKDDAEVHAPNRMITIHLDYRQRPAGPVPKDLLALRRRGCTVEWVEEVIGETSTNLITFVQARLALSRWKRRHAVPSVAPLQSPGGPSALNVCGVEYRSAKRTPDAVSMFRWSEQRPGNLDVQLAYSYFASRMRAGFWGAEEKRCRRHLLKLL